MEELLDQLINESAESSFDRATPIKGMSQFFSKKKAILNVLVGALRKPKNGYHQLNICLKHGFYHIPLEHVKSHLSNIEYVALYQQKYDYPPGGIRYYGRVKDFQILKRNEIKELPPNRDREDRLYVRFNVVTWEERNLPVEARGYGIASHLFTTWELFTQATELPELTLKNDTQYRLWRELRRIDQNVRLHLKNRWADYVKEDELLYEVMGTYIIINPQENRVLLKKGGQHQEVSLTDFSYRPHKILKLIDKWNTSS